MRSPIAAIGPIAPALLAVAATAAGCDALPLDAVTVGPANLAMGLVAHWAFDEGSGTVAGDSSGNGHHGQLTGGTWTADGRFAGALEVHSGDFVAVPDFPDATPGWTASVWTRSTEEQIAAETPDGMTLMTAENVFEGGWQFHLDNRAGIRRFDAAYWAGSTVNDYVVVFCDCVEADRWIHMTAVFDGQAGHLSFYRDDALVDRQDMPMPILPGDSTLYFGRWNMNGRLLDTTIDDFAIWSRALTREEIAVLSRQPPPAP